MKLAAEKTTGNQSTKMTVRFGKKMERFVVSLVVWTLTLTFPVWIYGLLLAIGKGEFRPITAMFVLIAVSGFCCWIKIIKPLKAKSSAGKTIIIEDENS